MDDLVENTLDDPFMDAVEALPSAFLNQGRAERYREKYGLDIETVGTAWKDQGGRCCICNVPIAAAGLRGMHIDHDHQTGRNRGLLCASCNLGLGNFRDSPKLLLRAIKYLKDEAIFGGCHEKQKEFA
jgi:hypothetical protein